ncbi:MAG TPA: SNF2-related protein [Polyangiaceae bacterium]|nr:SNF2-related protein [Polyangiaceae bacterium]
MPSPISDALSTLSDRGLRRLLGARTFLRGLDYARRRVVEDVQVAEASAQGRVKGSDSDPYTVRVDLTPEGIQSNCTCPAFAKAGQHCKHVAALLITVRDQARGAQPRREPPQPVPQTAHAGGDSKSRRRDRRRRAVGGGMPPGAIVPAPREIGALPPAEASARATGVGAWLPPPGTNHARPIEFRVHARQQGLTVTVLDTEARVPLLPSVALAWQSLHPTQDRDALRLLRRFESGNPRHPAVDVRGEDAADLLPMLNGRRVLLEPALMQLRFSDEPLKPRFDLEMIGGETIVAKASFERPSDRRRFSLLQGGWYEGAPGWHVDTSEGIARPIDRRTSPAALLRLLRSPTIAEPMSELVQVIMDGLPRVALEVGAELPDLGQVADVVDLEPTFRMRAGGSLIEAHVTLIAAYRDTEVAVRADGISPPVIIKPPEEGQKRARCIRCDIAAQQAAAERLKALGLRPDETGQYFVAQGEHAIKFWSEGIGSLPDDWDLFVPDDLVDTQVRSKPIAAHARVSSGMDWLSLKLSFESDGVSVSRDELARCLAEGKKYVRLDDGSFAAFDPVNVKAMLEREVELMMAAGKNGRFPLSQAGRLQELLGHASEALVPATTKDLFKKLQSIDEIEAAKKPRGLKGTLRPYQEQGLSWLKFIHDIGSGGVLADDMGLGKTLQTIALLLSVKQEEKSVKALIVAPTSVVTNWVREIERFAPTLTVALWHGQQRKEQQDELETADVIITSYALLRRDEEMLKELDLTYAILDEAQHIKNPMSATAAAAKRLRAKRRLALTGTPIENRLSEIWSIFDFVSPGLLGPLNKFEERFARPIADGDHKTAARLRATIHPFILRRTKSEVAKDLPEKIEMDQICDLAGEQKSLYTQVVREVRAQIMGDVERLGVSGAHIQILAGLTRLRQAACDPRLLGLPRPFSDEDSGKLIALRELVEECEAGGHKVLVFSQFVTMLQLIKNALDKDGITYEYLDGSTKDRPERVDRFQNDPGCTVFLISLKAGGTGLNLTAADTVIHFDPWWNPAVEDQATDRAHRIGQTKVVTAYRLVAAGTIEEKILQLKAKKRELVSSVLTEDAGGAKKLTKSDLDELFSTD